MFKKFSLRKKPLRTETSPIIDDVIRASGLLTRDMNFKNLVSVLVEQSLDVTRSDISVFYSYTDNPEQKDIVIQIYKRGRWDVPLQLDRNSSLIEFLEESRESVIVLNKSENRHFPSIILHKDMQSAIALPIFTPDSRTGFLILNSTEINYFNRSRFQFLDSFSRMAAGMINNARLFNEMKESYKRIESLERYQEGIFSSMTDLLLTLDSDGKLHFANEAAIKSFQIEQNSFGKSFQTLFQSMMDSSIIKSIGETSSKGKHFLGLQGIYKDKLKDIEIDFKLNLSPLIGIRGKKLGSILIFTDETKERDLKNKMSVVTEERRQIKDMFARYLSKDIVNSLINEPELVKLGGDQKQATVLFADIRGYTSFSEGKDPAYIIEILNEYFNEAVESVISNKGYIDKFIGDCIMAAWGVPMVSEEEDAINAVTCALQIQKLIQSSERLFFKGQAENLKVGIGMHTGHLVAGNLGSASRMDYTIIGDTVNIAARLEGVAEAGEIIITQSTRDKLGDLFLLEKRPAVKVKGKANAIPIYNVIDKLK
jgi:class 3 adenylate cyclase/PAS domain-containing protein